MEYEVWLFVDGNLVEDLSPYATLADAKRAARSAIDTGGYDEAEVRGFDLSGAGTPTIEYTIRL